jgi:hypothetical protein
MRGIGKKDEGCSKINGRVKNLAIMLISILYTFKNQ